MSLSEVKPRVIVSGMLAGITDGISRLEIVREAIAFPWIDLTGDPLIAGIHTALHPDLKAAAAQLLYPNLPFINKLKRFGLTLFMRSLENTLDQAATLPQDVYLVLHPDNAAYLCLKLEGLKLQVPPNVIIAVENDHGIHRGHYLPQLFPGENPDPSHPATVKSLTQKLAILGVRTNLVLDIHHLHDSLPGMTIAEAMAHLGGRVDILHLSGDDHTGYSLPQIIDFTHQTNPRLVVLEGPVPPCFLLGLTHKELAALNHHIEKIKSHLNGHSE